MSMVNPTDIDFRLCSISFDTLLEIQLEAEDRNWATRWTSVDALRGQVKEGAVVIQSWMREKREGVVRAYRCLVLFSTVDGGNAGAIATIDIDPARFGSLEQIDCGPAVRILFARLFALAAGGIAMVSKR